MVASSPGSETHAQHEVFKWIDEWTGERKVDSVNVGALADQAELVFQA